MSISQKINPVQNFIAASAAIAATLIFCNRGVLVFPAVMLVAVLPAILLLSPAQKKNCRAALAAIPVGAAFCGAMMPVGIAIGVALIVDLILFIAAAICQLYRQQKKLSSQIPVVVVVLGAMILLLTLIANPMKSNYYHDVYIFAIAFAALAISLIPANLYPKKGV